MKIKDEKLSSLYYKTSIILTSKSDINIKNKTITQAFSMNTYSRSSNNIVPFNAISGIMLVRFCRNFSLVYINNPMVKLILLYLVLL